MATPYKPIDPDFFELFQEAENKENSKVVYFAVEEEPRLRETVGKIVKTDKAEDAGYYLFFENGDSVRVDRIVAFNGKPGPAYDEYDAYGLAPLTCEAGYSDCQLDS